MIKKAVLVSILGLFLSAPAFAAPVYGVCEKQVTDYVQNQLGTEVKTIRFFHKGEERAGQQVWVNVENCDGAYVFELSAGQHTCNTAHYGRIPNYIRYVWSYGNCPDL